jgi:hypothetical protein
MRVEGEHPGGAEQDSRKNRNQNDENAKALAFQLGLPERT